MKTWQLTAALLAAGLTAVAEDGPVIAPETIVTGCLQHSRRLRAADAELSAAGAARVAARALALPSLRAEAAASHVEGLRDFSVPPVLTIPGIEDRYRAALTLTQPLFTGGRLRAGRRQAAWNNRAAVETRRQVEAETVLQALQSYWNWSKARDAVDVLAASVTRMQAHETDVGNRRDAGLATDNDLLSTQVLLDQTRLQAQEARRRVDRARAALALLLGRPLPDTARPQHAEPPEPEPLPPETNQLAAAAARRPEPAARRHAWRAATAAARAARGPLFPQCYLTAQYETARPNDRIFPPEDTWQDVAYVGLTLRWDVFDWGLNRARLREARDRAEQARLAAAQAEDEVVYDVRAARIDLANATARLPVVERAEHSARLNLATVTDQWDNGLARHAEVLDAHSQLTRTRYDVAAARADWALARATLDYALGELTPPSTASADEQ